MRGVARYTDWKTETHNVGVADDWLVMCGTNDGATLPGNVLIDQNEIGTAVGGVGSCRLNIGHQGSDQSDWALHSLLIWDYSLGNVNVPWHNRPCLMNLVAGSAWFCCPKAR